MVPSRGNESWVTTCQQQQQCRRRRQSRIRQQNRNTLVLPNPSCGRVKRTTITMVMLLLLVCFSPVLILQVEGGSPAEDQKKAADAMKAYWKRTFDDIKDLTSVNSVGGNNKNNSNKRNGNNDKKRSSSSSNNNKKKATTNSSTKDGNKLLLTQWKSLLEPTSYRTTIRIPTSKKKKKNNNNKGENIKDGNKLSQKQWQNLLEQSRDMMKQRGEEEETSSSSRNPNSLNFNSFFNTKQQNESPQVQQPKRFDGFASWEQVTQQWKDDINDYVDKASATIKEASSSSSNGNTNNDSKNNDKNDGQSSVSFDLLTSLKTIVEEYDVQSMAPKRFALATGTNSDNDNDRNSSDIDDNYNDDDNDDEITVEFPIPQPVKLGIDKVLEDTDISNKGKKLWIVTTASLPWMTGTAVNPLLRAAYLTKGRKDAGGKVTLMLPWLEKADDQIRVYGKEKTFNAPEDQEEYIRNWLRNDANMPDAADELHIAWYTAWQNRQENSIYSMGDIVGSIPADDVDICILEEPEHLNWYRAPGESWTGKFNHVVGIIHTNYFVYAQDQPAAFVRAPAMRLLCSWMCRVHCHRIIKLSGTLDQFAPEKELVENVHGVRGTFIDIGNQLRKELIAGSTGTTNGSQHDIDLSIFEPDVTNPKIYFIGKMLWSKGLLTLMDLLKYAKESADLSIDQFDMYGGGPDLEEAKSKSQSDKYNLNMVFHGPVDHSKLAYTHKIFINPSTSEVLCTTVAEALAMGKFVILPSHPSNDFFAQFPNCLPYASKEEFVGNLYYAMTHKPEPMSDEYSYALTWDAATERLEAAGCISVEEATARDKALQAIEEYTKDSVKYNNVTDFFKAATNVTDLLSLKPGDSNNLLVSDLLKPKKKITVKGGVEINLPPIIEDEETKAKVVSTFKETRDKYRQFRSKLSTEIKESNLLPREIQKRLIKELDKRLDVDIDELIDNPKLSLQLSPAELEQRLLKFYETISAADYGDLLRLIGGGTDVGAQNLYMKRQMVNEQKRKQKEQEEGQTKDGDDKNEDDVNDFASLSSFFPESFMQRPNTDSRNASGVDGNDDEGDYENDSLGDSTESIATKLVKRALKRNLPKVRNSKDQMSSSSSGSSTSLRMHTTAAAAVSAATIRQQHGRRAAPRMSMTLDGTIGRSGVTTTASSSSDFGGQYNRQKYFVNAFAGRSIFQCKPYKAKSIPQPLI